jgi:hypothetical protein
MGIGARFPDAEALDGVTIAKPVRDEETSSLALSMSVRDILIDALLGKNGEGHALDIKSGAFGFAHVG